MTFQDISKQIGQLMVFGFPGQKMTTEIRTLIHEHSLGSIILFPRNIEGPEQVRSLTLELQTEAKKAGLTHPLLICTDQENGTVRRLKKGFTVFPGSMLTGATHSPALAAEIGRRTAEEMKEAGVNWDLAPVVDVNNNPLNPVISTRSFGEDPDEVAEMAENFMTGMQSAGVIPTLKHFPGHGDTSVDSHLDLPVIDHDMKRLNRVELIPFKKCIQAGADVIMSAHVYFPAIEKQPGVPATLSRSVLTGLLRNQLHFQGVITTDCMEMNAISEGVGTANGAVKALQAGADMIMISHTYSKQQEALNKVLAGLKNGLIDETQLVQSINRIHVLKQKYLSWEEALKRETVQVKTGTDENKAFADYVYSEGVSIIRNSKKIIPFSADGKTLFIYDTHISYTNVEDKKDHLLFLEGVIRSVAPSADIFDDSDPKLYEVFDEMANGERSYSGIAVLTSSIAGKDQRVEKLMDLEKAGIPMVVIAGKSPYVVRHVPDNIPCICTYELTEPALKKAIKALFGMDVAKGIPPVTL